MVRNMLASMPHGLPSHLGHTSGHMGMLAQGHQAAMSRIGSLLAGRTIALALHKA